MLKRVGLTMRIVKSHTGELRDCLAHDWAAFIRHALPEVSWLPLPKQKGRTSQASFFPAPAFGVKKLLDKLL